MKSSFYLLLIVLLSVFPALAQDDPDPETTEEASDVVSLEERGYGVYVPSYFTRLSDPAPLLIALHGFGDTVQNFAPATGLLQEAEDHGFVVAFPNGYLRQWNDGSRGDHYQDDVAMLMELIEVIAADITIDRERIYLTGFSNGGAMTYRAHCDMPDAFAGIAVVGGSLRFDQDCADDARTNVIIIRATDDAQVPFMGSERNRRYPVPETAQQWAERNGCTDQLPLLEIPFEGRVMTQHWEDCADNHEVMLVAINEMGHLWSGAFERVYRLPIDESIDASHLLWEFFEATYQRSQDAPNADDA